jgi:hypothetical protein
MSLIALASESNTELSKIHPLTGQPDINFFKLVIVKQLPFAKEAIDLDYTPSASLGSWITIPISRKGDLVTGITLQFTLDGLLQLPASRLGVQLVETVELYIGNVLIDEHLNQWMDIWSQLTFSDEEYSKWLLMTTGSSLVSTRGASLYTTCYVPLLFWFCRHSPLALPLIALEKHEVKLKLKLAPWFAFTPLSFPVASLVSGAPTRVPSSHIPWLIPVPTESVYDIGLTGTTNRPCQWVRDNVVTNINGTCPVEVRFDTTWGNASPLFVFDTTTIMNIIQNERIRSRSSIRLRVRFAHRNGVSDVPIDFILQPAVNLFDLSVMADYVFLPEYERQRLTRERLTLLIYQTQMNPISKGDECRLYFKNPCRSIVWYQKHSAQLRFPRLPLQSVLLDHPFNYRLSLSTPLAYCAQQARLVFESGHVQSEWRYVNSFYQNVECARAYIYSGLQTKDNVSSEPLGGFYSYSFRLPVSTCEASSLNWQPDGTFNFSAIDDAKLEFRLSDFGQYPLSPMAYADWLLQNTPVDTTETTTVCFALTYNFLIIHHGMAKLLYP